MPEISATFFSKSKSENEEKLKEQNNYTSENILHYVSSQYFISNVLKSNP